MSLHTCSQLTVRNTSFELFTIRESPAQPMVVQSPPSPSRVSESVLSPSSLPIRPSRMPLHLPRSPTKQSSSVVSTRTGSLRDTTGPTSSYPSVRTSSSLESPRPTPTPLSSFKLALLYPCLGSKRLLVSSSHGTEVTRLETRSPISFTVKSTHLVDCQSPYLFEKRILRPA